MRSPVRQLPTITNASNKAAKATKSLGRQLCTANKTSNKATEAIKKELARHKLHTHVLMDISAVNSNDHFPSTRSLLVFMMFRVGGNFKDLLKPLFWTLEPDNYSK